MPDLTLAGLTVVRAVADRGSFTAAADALGYTQSAVSRQVAVAETALGTSLFIRGARGVVPSAAGEIVARRAAAVLDEVDAAGRELAALRDRVSGRVVVAAFPAACAVLVPRTVARLQREHPGVRLQLGESSTPTQLRQVRGRRIDVAVIGVGHGLPEYDLGGLRRQLLLDGRLLVVVSADHRLARRERVPVSDLVEQPWIVGRGARGDPQFGAWPTLQDPVIAYSAREWPTRFGLVAAGVGLTVVPELAAASVPAGVRTLEVDDPHWLGRSAVAVTHSDPRPAVATVVAALRREATRLRTERQGAPARA